MFYLSKEIIQNIINLAQQGLNDRKITCALTIPRHRVQVILKEKELGNLFNKFFEKSANIVK